MVLAGEAPELAWLTGIVDFYALSEARDLLFHVQEQSYALPDIARMIARAGLNFLGLETGRDTRRAFGARFGGKAAASLVQWDRFERENPDSFVGLYLLWLQAPE